jgi:hypothetical protein
MRYSATPTCADFLRANAQVKLICGPVGGGKSTAALMEALRRAMNQTPFEDGVRRTKGIVLRNTLQQLKSTVKPLIDQWFTTIMGGTLGAWRVTDNVFHLRFAMGDGTTVDSEWWLMAADTPDDVRRLLSVEASWGWAEECREIDPEVFRGFRGRMNRYPNVAMGGITDPGVFCSTNPPPIGSYWHEMMTAPPEGWAVFMQPPAILDDGALNPAAENLEFGSGLLRESGQRSVRGLDRRVLEEQVWPGEPGPAGVPLDVQEGVSRVQRTAAHGDAGGESVTRRDG